MQYKFSAKSLLAFGLLSSEVALGAYLPSEPWSTLTPSGSAPAGATTDYTSTFAIAISTVTSSSSGIPSSAIGSVGGLRKRDVVSQIGDGQLQATTGTAAAKSTAQAVSQITDGQIQATTGTTKAAKETAQAVSQITDGQIQATTGTEAAKTTAQAVSQITDGQIQATTGTTDTAAAVSQITDGQIQATTGTTTTETGASQITDGQIQASGSSSSSEDDLATEVACKTSGTLAMTLNSSVLVDAQGRIGSIVANHQFQFDATPQAGALYAVGWSVTSDGYLAIGDDDLFYECSSGNFYNLYDESIGGQCTAVRLAIVELQDC